MADDLILSDDEFDTLRSQLRSAFRRAHQPIPDVLDFAAIATHKDNAARVYTAIEFAEPPEWAPFLPVTGTYIHPWYGQLDYDLPRYERIVANFKAGIYQSQLPVNAEHDPQASGAVGWITDMRINADTSIDAKVEWNDRGRQLIEGDRYRYVSAELWDEWTDPVSGITYPDVAIGLAICTNPFFKESVLRPLAASDAVWTYRPGNGQEVTGMSDAQQHAASGQTNAAQFTEAERAEFREAKRRADDLAVKLSETETALAKTAADLESLRKDQRVARFTSEVRGKSDDNGKVWIGETQAHVDMLVSLAEAFGEDSAQFKQYVAINRAAATQDALTKPIGENGNGESVSALSEINKKAEAMAAASDGRLTFSEAFTKVMDSDADLRARYVRERR